MPIAFPPRTQATLQNNVAAVFKLNKIVQVKQVLPRPGTPFTRFQLDPGIGIPARMPNLFSPGFTYSDVARTAVVNPILKYPSSLSARARVGGIQNTYLSNAVTRDTNTAGLGSVRVMFFRTQDNSFVGETLSDASGNWSKLLNIGGPFFLVCYKIGSPDVAGTSVNTLTPVPG